MSLTGKNEPPQPIVVADLKTMADQLNREFERIHRNQEMIKNTAQEAP